VSEPERPGIFYDFEEKQIGETMAKVHGYDAPQLSGRPLRRPPSALPTNPIQKKDDECE
jgi:hypothetical protein